MTESKYAPKFNYETFEPEDINIYIERASKLLPNFPKEVMIQWFYDHPQQVNEHEWLIYERLKFDLTEWETDKVPTSDFGNTGAVETYRYNYFVNGFTSSRREKLESYFISNGTWPVPPIFLINFQGKLVYPSGFPCGKPYHLLEGHNRMAFFLEYKKQKSLSKTHKVYIADRI